uniref:Uncharacterized protein n=1 Tax=Tanacetum cinerariifolium TaxID=118510 RepID=A0A6L2MP42_TANCI|nr:hypothetical protein [Tanacetum cinerariifolium]
MNQELRKKEPNSQSKELMVNWSRIMVVETHRNLLRSNIDSLSLWKALVVAPFPPFMPPLFTVAICLYYSTEPVHVTCLLAITDDRPLLLHLPISPANMQTSRLCGGHAVQLGNLNIFRVFSHSSEGKKNGNLPTLLGRWVDAAAMVGHQL